MATMLVVDQYYQDKDHQIGDYDLLITGISGAVAGAGMKALEEREVVVKTIVNAKESVIKYIRNLGGNNGSK
ncbi:hypothetical protein [Methylotenera sp. L2L1]|uniref:hypothetical protein n=1 Tax=Methylotenera sp. L2L1 TaxID=1502770 RepID=UPI000A50556A|nr:hypothetical protein [Methylotenera sp. L2L1]